jgi:hypothetical protein
MASMDYNNAVRYTVSLPEQQTSWTQVVDHTVTAYGMVITFECLRPTDWPTDDDARCYSTQHVAWERGVPPIIIEQTSRWLAKDNAAAAWADRIDPSIIVEDSSHDRRHPRVK